MAQQGGEISLLNFRIVLALRCFRRGPLWPIAFGVRLHIIGMSRRFVTSRLLQTLSGHSFGTTHSA